MTTPVCLGTWATEQIIRAGCTAVKTILKVLQISVVIHAEIMALDVRLTP
jgi:hypothetical protein